MPRDTAKLNDFPRMNHNLPEYQIRQTVRASKILGVGPLNPRTLRADLITEHGTVSVPAEYIAHHDPATRPGYYVQYEDDRETMVLEDTFESLWTSIKPRASAGTNLSGCIVHYMLRQEDAENINSTMLNQGGMKTPVSAGQIWGAIITKVIGHDENPPVTLRLLLEGGENYWITDRQRTFKPTPGAWHYPAHS